MRLLRPQGVLAGFHAEVGEYARRCGIEQFFTLGEQSREMRGRHFDDVQALNAAVCGELPRVASMLVKGSRFMKMERVVAAVTAHTSQLGREASRAT